MLLWLKQRYAVFNGYLKSGSNKPLGLPTLKLTSVGAFTHKHSHTLSHKVC